MSHPPGPWAFRRTGPDQRARRHRANAAILGLDRVTGAVRTGLAADLVVLASNPLDGFRASVDPELVIIGGSIIEHPTVTRFDEIDARLDSF
ncbi:hypothetical protein FOE78_16005 [Microlunatus elymi]|uniref:Amidohydrolase family protein n=1 Tax=Microlunatus elymi TaxID=2596828 RepID=A0A516Q1F1_9ACTN|nr:hypothetical protein [Microlunatus elymi]QDP97228.1 hypothetical protein FOE78_16005 [Microlunatus elymi]